MNVEHAKAAVDAGVVGTVIATVIGWLPSISAVLTVLWLAFRLWEMQTTQRIVAWIKSKWPK